jgi:hypothetical protein
MYSDRDRRMTVRFIFSATKVNKDSEITIPLPDSGMGTPEIAKSRVFYRVCSRFFPYWGELYPIWI